MMSYFPFCNSFPTDKTLLTSDYTISFAMANVQTNCIPWFPKFSTLQLGHAILCTQDESFPSYSIVKKKVSASSPELLIFLRDFLEGDYYNLNLFMLGTTIIYPTYPLLTHTLLLLYALTTTTFNNPQQ